MGSTIDSSSESIGKSLKNLSEDDRRLFLEYKKTIMGNQVADSPLLDQLCWVRLVRTRLLDNYTIALSASKEKLKERIDMPGGWRESRTVKTASEFESPMPWLHPFKLAAEELKSFEEGLNAAVSSGETEEKDATMLQEVLDKYDIRFPITSSHLSPKFPPRSLRIFN